MQNRKTLQAQVKIVMATAIVLLLLMFAACAKEEITPNTPLTPAAAASFNWTSNGTTTTADSAICYLQLTTIYAYKNGTSQTIEINLSDITSGTYPINAASGNEITYVNASVTKLVNSGTVSLTNTSGSKLSGSFEGSFSAGSGSISGQFSNVSFR